MPSPVRHRAPAVFLSVHADLVSGAVLSVPEFKGKKVTGYEVVRMGEVKRQSGRDEWAKCAVAEANDTGVPLIVVGRTWNYNPEAGAVISGLGTDWGRWLAAFERAEIPDSHILLCPPAWRRSNAREHAENKLGMACLSDPLGESICLRLWAEHAAEVHAVLAPKSKRKKAA